MSPSEDTPRRARSKWLLLSLFLMLGAAGGIIAFIAWPTSLRMSAPVSLAPASLPVAAAIQPPTAPPRAAVVPAPTVGAPGPSFDVVRVGPEGRAVIAGRAERGAEVTVYDGGHVLGTVKADEQGQFVMLPESRLGPGGRELTLSARNIDGTSAVGADSVILIVPPTQAVAAAAAEPAPSPLAVLLPRGGEAPRVLAGSARKLALDTVDYDEAGEIRFAGSAKPGVSVRVYVDNRAVGDTKSGADGQWVFLPGSPVAPGVHQLRIDQLGPDGRVSSRVELPFQRTATVAAPDATAPAGTGGRAVVQPGQNLWRIARQSYGQGTRYTVIYLANREQIRDPNRIYPGQIFAVPPRS